jgi:hypothetical protein
VTTGSCSQLQGVTALLWHPPITDDTYGDAKSDGRYVYFDGSTAIYRVPVSGGVIETVTSFNRSLGVFGSLFAVNAGTISWLYANPGMNTPAGMMVENASGVHDVALPTGVTPIGQVLVDVDGTVFFMVDLASGDAGAPTAQVWRWNPATGSAAQMPGAWDAYGHSVDLAWVDRGQIFWESEVGVYATDISTGTAHQLDTANPGFGSPFGVDAKNLYGTVGLCPGSACTFTVWGTPRDGGAPFVAYQSTAYWSSGLQVDDSGLYWLDGLGIYHAPLTNGAPAQHLADLPTGGLIPRGFAMDACNLYWIGPSGTGAKQQVMAVPK